MKRIAYIIISMLLIVSILASCGEKTTETKKESTANSVTKNVAKTTTRQTISKNFKDLDNMIIGSHDTITTNIELYKFNGNNISYYISNDYIILSSITDKKLWKNVDKIGEFTLSDNELEAIKSTVVDVYNNQYDNYIAQDGIDIVISIGDIQITTFSDGSRDLTELENILYKYSSKLSKK